MFWASLALSDWAMDVDLRQLKLSEKREGRKDQKVPRMSNLKSHRFEMPLFPSIVYSYLQNATL